MEVDAEQLMRAKKAKEEADRAAAACVSQQSTSGLSQSVSTCALDTMSSDNSMMAGSYDYQNRQQMIASCTVEQVPQQFTTSYQIPQQMPQSMSQQVSASFQVSSDI